MTDEELAAMEAREFKRLSDGGYYASGNSDVPALVAEVKRLRTGIRAIYSNNGSTPEQNLMNAINSGLSHEALRNKDQFRMVDALAALVGGYQ